MSSRRKFIAALSSGVVAAVAGCTDGGGDGDTTTETTTATTTTTETTTTETTTTETTTTETTTTETTTTTPEPKNYQIPGTYPTFMANPGRTGEVSVSGPTRGVGRDWDSLVDSQNEGPFPPMLVDGRLYGAAGSKVARINPVNGEQDWSREFDTGLTGPIGVGGGAVYAPTRQGLFALDVRSGDQLWRSGSVKTFSSDVGPPVRVGDVVYVVATGQVYAVDAGDGSPVWTAGAAGQAGSVALGAGRAFTGGEGAVNAVTLDGGDRAWEASLPAAQRSFPRYRDGVVYAAAKPPENTPEVHAFSATGERLWEHTLSGGLQDARITAMGVDDNGVYVGTSPGTLHALSPEDGSRIWRNDLREARYYNPTIADGVLYAVNDVDNLVAMDLRRGEVLSKSRIPSGCYVPPAVEDGAAYVANKQRVIGLL